MLKILLNLIDFNRSFQEPETENLNRLDPTLLLTVLLGKIICCCIKDVPNKAYHLLNSGFTCKTLDF